jgi:hypothetical protein
MLKKALKNTDNLIGSLPGAMGAAAKSWKIMMFSEGAQPDSSESPADIDAFKLKNEEDVAGLSDEEIQEIMGAMREYEARIPDPDAESQLLEEEQLAMEDEVKELDDLEARIAEDSSTVEEKRKMEAELAERRVQLCVHRGGVGASMETTIGQVIAAEMVGALGASLYKALEELLRQVQEISIEINDRQAVLQDPLKTESDHKKAESELNAFKSNMQANLNAIQNTLEAQSVD